MKKHNKKTMKWLYIVPGKKRIYIYFLIALQVMLGMTGAAYAVLLRDIIDYAVKQQSDLFWNNVALLIILVLSQQAIQSLVRWMNEKTRATFENLIKRRLMSTLLWCDYTHGSGVHSGEWMNRLTNDTVIVSNGYVDIMPGIAGTVVRLASAFALLFALQPAFTLIIFPGGFVLALLTIFMRPHLKQLHKKMLERDGVLRSFLQERINSLIIIKSFSGEDKTLVETDQLMQDHQKARMRKNYFSNILNTGFALSMEGIYLFGTCYCAYGILKSSISYGTLAAVAQLVGQIRAPFAHMSGYIPTYIAMLASAERLMEAEAFPEDGKGARLSKQEIHSLYEDWLESFGLYHADYTYDAPTDEMGEDAGERMPVVLRDLTIEIRKGEYLAFTGPRGCGKSTVLKLLMSMYSLDRGERLIRTWDGEQIPLDARYRRLFAYVPQGNQLMSGTIRQIVSFAETEGRPDEDRINEALRLACAWEFVEELEEGVDTLLGERGAGLSEGQMQRIAIARALYSEAPVLLLDEATSALDAETEKKLLLNLKNLTDRTVVIVTHRDAALKICDREIEFTEKGAKEKWSARKE